MFQKSFLRSYHSPPDFLVIGAQKSATTWLWKCLREHPTLYFPPKKELHYFDRSKSYPSPSVLAESSPLKRYDKDMLQRIYREIRKKSTSFKDYQWYLRYYFKPCSDRWYCSLFKSKARDQLAGEVTPSYAILEVQDIEKIYQLNEKARIVYLLRNPIDRAWSAFLMKLRKRKISIEAVPDHKVRRYFDSETCNRKSDYYQAIRKWVSIFPRDQIYIDYYDRIQEQPERLLDNIATHIGTPTTIRWDPQIVYQRFNEGLRHEIPAHHHEYLYKKYAASIQDLYDLLGDPIILKWLERPRLNPLPHLI